MSRDEWLAAEETAVIPRTPDPLAGTTGTTNRVRSWCAMRP